MTSKSRFRNQIKAMSSKAKELGFKNINEAEKAGFSSELKKAYDNAKSK